MYSLEKSSVLQVPLTRFPFSRWLLWKKYSAISCNFIYSTKFFCNSSIKIPQLSWSWLWTPWAIHCYRWNKKIIFLLFSFLWVIVFKLSYLKFCICLMYSWESVGTVHRAQMKAVRVEYWIVRANFTSHCNMYFLDR